MTIGFNAFAGQWQANARLALDTIAMRPTRGIPTFGLNDMQWSHLETLSGTPPGSYPKEPVRVYIEFSLKAGSNLPLHSHPHEQAGYIVSGKIRLTVGTETQELGPGGTYYAAPNVPHGAAILEDAIVVDTFSPPRQDYLPS